MERLREDVIQYRSWKATSDAYKTKFGDWPSVSRLISRAADGLPPDSERALRLMELSTCRDSKSSTRLNSRRVSDIIKNTFDLIQREFFPDLLSVCNKENRDALQIREPVKVFTLHLHKSSDLR